MLLYIIYIEPLLLKFKKELSGVRIADHPLKVGGHVDDQFMFLKNDDSTRRLWCIVESFENCTNALINRQKTRLLGLGAWKERRQWPFGWFLSKHKGPGYCLLPHNSRDNSNEHEAIAN